MYTLIIEDKNGVIADEFSFQEGSFSIGRVEGNDIILPSSNVSRQHSRLFVRQNRCYIEDLGSSNGVIVDGQRIQGERDLGSAAQIRIGDYYLYLEFNKDGNDQQQDVVSTLISSQDENAYKLVRVGDAFAGEVFVLAERQNSIGRTENNAVFLNDSSVSRRHAQIEVEGITYCLADMGSSNGTCVNGKRISGPTVLREGDRISFGNLDFIFVPNNEQVNVADYSAPVSSGRSGLSTPLIIGVLLFFFLMALVTAALIFAGYILVQSSKQQTADPTPVIQEEPSDEEKVEQAIAEGRAKMTKSRWSEAVESFDRALEIDQGNADAEKLKAKAEKELEAREKYNAGLKSKGDTNYEVAKEKFESVERDTEVYEKAQKEITEINSILAANLKGEGDQLFKQNKLLEAYAAYSKSIDLKCEEGVIQALNDTERKIKRDRRLRRKFKPYKIPARCK